MSSGDLQVIRLLRSAFTLQPCLWPLDSFNAGVVSSLSELKKYSQSCFNQKESDPILSLFPFLEMHLFPLDIIFRKISTSMLGKEASGLTLVAITSYSWHSVLGFMRWPC